jgi:hypothetical protein
MTRNPPGRFLCFLLLLVAANAPAAGPPARILRNEVWSTRISVFGADLDVVKPAVHLTPGQQLDRLYVRCERDETTAKPTVKCNAVAPKPPKGSFWRWAANMFVIRDLPASASAARTVQAQLDASKVVSLGNTTIAIVELTEWVLRDEYNYIGDEDPTPIPTGKKKRFEQHSTEAYLDGYGLSANWYFSDGVLAMLGSGKALLVRPELVIAWGTVHEQRLRETLGTPHTSAGLLKYLEQAQEPDPDVRLALAWDRVLVAVNLHDPQAFTSAWAAFDAERQARTTLPKVFDDAFARTLPILELVAAGKVTLTPPFGIPYVDIP